jgi:hypothetical protein
MWDKALELLTGFATYLIAGVKIAAGFIGARILAAFGLTWVNYKYVLPDVKSFIADKASDLPATVIGIFGASGIDIFMTLIISAYVARIGARAFLAGASALDAMIDNAGG